MIRAVASQPLSTDDAIGGTGCPVSGKFSGRARAWIELVVKEAMGAIEPLQRFEGSFRSRSCFGRADDLQPLGRQDVHKYEAMSVGVVRADRLPTPITVKAKAVDRQLRAISHGRDRSPCVAGAGQKLLPVPRNQSISRDRPAQAQARAGTRALFHISTDSFSRKVSPFLASSDYSPSAIPSGASASFPLSSYLKNIKPCIVDYQASATQIGVGVRDDSNRLGSDFRQNSPSARWPTCQRWIATARPMPLVTTRQALSAK